VVGGRRFECARSQNKVALEQFPHAADAETAADIDEPAGRDKADAPGSIRFMGCNLHRAPPRRRYR
jgi:hypothetical protein